MRRYRELTLEELWKLLSRVACSPERRRISRSPSPEATESHAIHLFQEVRHNLASCWSPWHSAFYGMGLEQTKRIVCNYSFLFQIISLFSLIELLL